MSVRTDAIQEMCSLIKRAIGNVDQGDEPRAHAKQLLAEALRLEGVAAGWQRPSASSECPHCGRDTPHQHVIDRKGKFHDDPESDIVSRLRASMAGFDICLPGAAMAKEAADEIERLRHAINREVGGER